MAPDFSKETPRILQIGISSGILSPSRVSRAARHAAEHPGVPVGRLLLENGDCTREALERIIAQMSSKLFLCPDCGTTASFPPDSRTRPCPACGRQTVLPEFAEVDPGSPGTSDFTSVLHTGHRYRMGEEIGRGGLGRIISAEDTALGREVAFKEILPESDSEKLRERFLRESRVAGRLAHPNIIPVHDIGVVERDGEKVPCFVMTRIEGRDLADILKALAGGRERDRFTRNRLLRIFQDVCQAMAYAHGKGVVHRDLKPANIMVGSFGEVFIVDWGLAKSRDETDPIAPSPDAVDAPGQQNRVPHEEPFQARLTLAGDVLGTPAYMAPEQLAGRPVDERADIYSLGVILYELMTFQTPFDGKTIDDILSQVMNTTPTAPSLLLNRLRAEAAREAAMGGPDDLAALPADFESVILRALSPDPSHRFPTVQDLHDEVERFLDGEKQRKRNLARAEKVLARGRDIAARLPTWREARQQKWKEAEATAQKLKPFWPVEKKRGLWAIHGEIKSLEDRIAKGFTQAARLFQAALEFDRDFLPARAALADLYLDQYHVAEKRGDRAEMIRCEGFIREYNDGQHDAFLKGYGTLSVRTEAYPCPCLRDGRSAGPDEFDVLGFHPYSGRPLSKPEGRAGLPELEPSEPVRLRAHGPDCTAAPLDGADAWLYRLEERDHVLVPVCPKGFPNAPGISPKLPDVRDVGELGPAPLPEQGAYLGQTPVGPVPLLSGSWLLLILKDGFAPVCVPLHVQRQTDQEMRVTLYGENEIPDGFLQISGGPFQFQGDVGIPHTDPRSTVDVGDVFIARHPVTCAEYKRFLDDLHRTRPDEAEARVPRETDDAGQHWVWRSEGGYQFKPGPQDPAPSASRLQQCPVDWEESWPVLGISWFDLMAYAHWARQRSNHLIGLPHDIAWEKAARGVDGRIYPWGDVLDATYCNCVSSHDGPSRPCPVEAFPVDRSPYGMRGAGGNARDWCLNDESAERHPGFRICRGGFWFGSGIYLRLALRTGLPPASATRFMGGRVALYPKTKL